jgi:hypothetical protein
MAAFSSPPTATIPTGLPRPKTYSKRAARRISLPQEKKRQLPRRSSPSEKLAPKARRVQADTARTRRHQRP